MPDHEVHEIQLNGKQLVFMFMAATVVSVVIFLCGVMVGRGVRQPVIESLAAPTSSSIDPTGSTEALSTQAASEPEPAPEKEDLTYAERLESRTPLNEPLRLAETRPAVTPPVTEKPIEKARTDRAEPAPSRVPEPKEPTARKAANIQTGAATKPDAIDASSRFAEPPGKGVVYQVRAFPTIGSAEALAARLKGKGYPTFITVNPDKSTGKYRVRVGKFSNKGEADAVLRRLKQEEHFEPWVIR